MLPSPKLEDGELHSPPRHHCDTTRADADRFLLKYVSRDAVEILGSGGNGVAEARTTISKYEDLSPLYGMIMYRRKKVLIKYVPEGTSRLLQGVFGSGEEV